ncbi:Gfo/Idh/MocA family protein [Arcticibacter tournemirensis]|uniref:Gfo/Idh/MocA family oxidoreductase n=1 Tax=Arcticibacter tournemirensis TaxID=699437 RepID=A0A4Q0M6T1_9SPHI|nr:Gfo/Idh/MocA family oxidoreductase [Arcticibacter tournemirensis]RXF68778.1 Gfo/Idh/MocA family oxidoreductase [Arcticibacter tournemirensis]
MNRRDFIAQSAIAAAGLTILPSGVLFAKDRGSVRLGYIGVGLRGRNHINEGLLRNDVEIVAICDTQESSLKLCREQFVKAGKALPKEYTGGTEAYKKLLERKDIDGVIISTPWAFHKDQAVDAMNAGKYVGCEVIAGLTVDDHWDIVNTSEKTGVPYMTLENVCYRRDVMAVLNMVRNGLFGELVHLEGGYQHDLRPVLFNDGKHFYGKGVEFGQEASIGEAQWRTQYNIDLNADIYPTHGIGPLMHYIDINSGNRFTNMVSFASKARGLSSYVEKMSPGHKNAKLDYKNGDVVTTTINCANGETVILSHDTHLPRPYSLGFRVQGTEGLWMDVADSIYIEGKSKNYDKWDPAKEWLEKYDHPLWKKYAAKAEGAGHGGMDWYVFNAFVQSVKQKKQTPIDVYDSVTMSVILPLSQKSISEGNQPQEFPDFTKGKWKSRKNTFALDDSGF